MALETGRLSWRGNGREGGGDVDLAIVDQLPELLDGPEAISHQLLAFRCAHFLNDNEWYPRFLPLESRTDESWNGTIRPCILVDGLCLLRELLSTLKNIARPATALLWGSAGRPWHESSQEQKQKDVVASRSTSRS